MAIDFTVFLHGIALTDELRGFIQPSYKAKAYLNRINDVQKIQPGALFEVALSWADYDVIENAFKHNQESLKVIHAPFVNGDKPNKVAGASRYVDLFSNSFDFVDKFIHMLKEIRKIVPLKQSITLIFHPLPYKDVIDNQDMMVDRLTRNLKKICSYLKEFNVYLGLENMPFFIGAHKSVNNIVGKPDFFSNVLEKCTCPNVGITFDFGHANSMARFLWEQGELSTQDLQTFAFQKRFFDLMSDRILHLHFHYNPAHLPTYNLGINRFIKKLRNYDFHESINYYSDEELTIIKNFINKVETSHRDNKPLTLTLEVLPRSLTPFNTYLNDLSLFKQELVR